MFLMPVIVFPSVNRMEMLHGSVLSAVNQTVSARIILSVPSVDHVLAKTLALPQVELAIGPIGSSCQRNLALSQAAHDDSVVFFFDDDVELDPRYVENMLSVFEQHPRVVVAGGVNLAYGALPGSLTRDVARRMLSSSPASPFKSSLRAVRSVAGCKMAVRGSLARTMRFDERLPLYGYLEDFDFCLRSRVYGDVVECSSCLMVHLEESSGRMGSRRRGYSEVVNPFYIYRKNVGADFFRIVGGAVKRTVSNALRYSDHGRVVRLSGNFLGWKAVISGELYPERIVTMDDT